MGNTSGVEGSAFLTGPHFQEDVPGADLSMDSKSSSTSCVFSHCLPLMSAFTLKLFGSSPGVSILSSHLLRLYKWKERNGPTKTWPVITSDNTCKAPCCSSVVMPRQVIVPVQHLTEAPRSSAPFSLAGCSNLRMLGSRMSSLFHQQVAK